MAWALLAIQLVLSLTLAIAASGKLLQSDEFFSALRLTGLPKRYILPFGFMLPLLEIGLSCVLVLGTSGALRLAMVTAAVLLGLFTVWLMWAWLRHPGLKCGCFGATGKAVGLQSVLRNAVMLLGSAVGFGLAENVHSPLPPFSFEMFVAYVSALVIVMLLVAFQSARAGMLLTMDQLYRYREVE